MENVFFGGADISIGNDNVFASDACIVSYNHGMNPTSETPYMDQPLQDCKAITIGSGNWFGNNVTVLPGVTIGDKCVIGAGSVVTKDVPSYSIAAGNPAKVIKSYNFEQDKWEKYNTSKQGKL